ncbi:MAG: hypothetical protein WCP35_12240 [Verrucomicrobiota bacterium]
MALYPEDTEAISGAASSAFYKGRNAIVAVAGDTCGGRRREISLKNRK